MINENSHRDNVKDAIFEHLEKLVKTGDVTTSIVDEAKYAIADAVFNALGITEDEQDRCGGYWMLHASKGDKPAPLPRDNDDKSNRYTIRTKELASGSKYTSEEFKAYATGRRITGNYWYISLQTPICKYGQSYDKDMVLDEAKMNFTKSHYPMYLDNYERSKDIDKMDKE